MLYLESFYRAAEVKYLTASLILRAMGCFESTEITLHADMHSGEDTVYGDDAVNSDGMIDGSTIRSFRLYASHLTSSCCLNAASCKVLRKRHQHVRPPSTSPIEDPTDQANIKDSTGTTTTTTAATTATIRIVDVANLDPLQLCEEALVASDSIAGKYRRIMVLEELHQ